MGWVSFHSVTREWVGEGGKGVCVVCACLLWPNPIVTMFPPTLLSMKYFNPSMMESRDLVPPHATTVLLRIFPIFCSARRDLTFRMRGDTRPCSPIMFLTPLSRARAASSWASLRLEPSGHSTNTSFPFSKLGRIVL